MTLDPVVTKQFWCAWSFTGWYLYVSERPHTNYWSTTNHFSLLLVQCALEFLFSTPQEGARYCDQHVCMSGVCLSTCVSQNPLVLSSGNFLYMLLWPSIGPPLTTVQYVMYFRSCDDVMFSHNRPYTDTRAWILQRGELFTVNRQVAPLNCTPRDEVCYRWLPLLHSVLSTDSHINRLRFCRPMQVLEVNIL